MANKPGEANFFPDVPQFPNMGTFQPVYGKFDLTTYIQGASDYEIMAFLVGKYNACLEAYGTVTKLSSDTVTACKQLQDWINSWFDNLDVQEELNNKIDSMVQNGSFGRLLHQTFDEQINQQTANSVTQWLVANVTPTGSAVVVDKSLSIEGAAADAKTVGDKFKLELIQLYNFSVLETLKNNNYTYHGITTNHISADFYNSDEPTSGSGTGGYHGIIGKLADAIPASSDFYLYFIGTFNFTSLALILRDSNSYGTATIEANAVDFVPIYGTSLYKVHMKCTQDTLGKSFTHVWIGGGWTPFSNFVCDLYILKDSTLYDIAHKDGQNLFDTYAFNALETLKPNTFKSHTTISNHISADFYNSDEPTSGSGTGGYYGIIGKLADSIPASSDFDLYFIGKFNFNQLALILRDSNSTGAATIEANAVDFVPIYGTSLYKVHMKCTQSTFGKSFTHVWIGGGYVPFSNFVCDLYILKDSTLYDIVHKDENQYDADIVFWGDSLTAGAGGSGTTYPAVCASELGCTALNMGVGGETAYTIAARQGGNNLLVYSKLNGITLNEMEGILGNVNPLRQGNAGVNPIIINGQECELSIAQSSISSTDATYTISGYDGTLKAKEPVAFSGSKTKGRVTVIFVGQNGPMDYSLLSPVIDSMISKTNGNCVIMGLSTGTKAEREALETQMLNHYGNNFFNTRDMLSQYGMSVAGLTPTETDRSEIASGAVPTSLRYDNVHLNSTGYTVLGKMLANKIRSLGFLNE